MKTTIERGLEDIILGHADAKWAYQVLGSILNNSERTIAHANIVYTAVREWVWKTLSTDSINTELVEWNGMLRKIAARVSDIDIIVGAKIFGLAELLHESIQAQQILNVEGRLLSDSVYTLLYRLKNTPGEAEFADILERQLGWTTIYLGHIINAIATQGWVSCNPPPTGRNLICLTSLGNMKISKDHERRYLLNVA